MKRKIVFILAILVLLFIWGQSLLPQAVSARESGWITLNIVRPLLSLFGINTISGNLVRKLAHVTEFFVLSTLVTLLFRGKILKSLFKCFIIAFLDESIQLFSGRGSQIRDVWIDLIGVGIGFTAGFLILFIRKRLREKREHENE